MQKFTWDRNSNPMKQLLPGCLLQFPLKSLQKVGYLSDEKVSKVALFFMAMAIVLSTFTIFLAWIQLLLFPNNIYGVVDNLECFGAHIQVLGKIIFLIHMKKKIQKMLSLSKEFWNYDMCGEETQESVKSVYKNLYNLQRKFLFAYLLCLSFMAVPVIFFGKSLPMGVWQIENQPELYLVFVILMQIFLLYYGIVVGSLDNLFMAFCVELAMQFRILCDGIEKLSVAEISTELDLQVHQEKLKKYLKYHKFLLSYLYELKSMFSYTLMIQYLSIVPLVCTELFASMASPNFAFSVRLFITGLCECLQLGMYCLAAEYVSNEASLVAVSVYSSDWYSQHFKVLKIPINMFIQISQKDVEFLALGLLKINANTMVAVFKLAMSTNAVLQSLLELSQ